MVLNWSPPKSDGGSPITGYVIEKKDKFGTRWNRVNPEPVKETNYKVTGLTQGEEYQFRIVAENKAGPGKPSDASETRVAKPPYGKLRILENIIILQKNCLFMRLAPIQILLQKS